MIMTGPFVLFLILVLLSEYWRRRAMAAGRPGIRHVTGFGVLSCALALNFWFATRLENIHASLSQAGQASVFATPWLWASALTAGVGLLIVSFVTRKSRR